MNFFCLWLRSIRARSAFTLLDIFLWELNPIVCCAVPMRPNEAETAGNIQAYSFFKGFSTGLVPLIREAIFSI